MEGDSSFLTAGGDRVATAMTSVFFYLSRNPSSYTRLADEVRPTFVNERDITVGSKIASCRYLRACISANLWRKQIEIEEKPLFIHGHYIPRGTLFGVNVYALSHNADVFPDPFVFKSERWLEVDSIDGAKRPMLEAFPAFSIGPRNRVGMPLVYVEVSIIVAKTL